MIWKVILLASVVACALAHGPAVSEQHFERHYVPAQRGHHGQLGHIGEHEQKHHEEYAWSYPSYEYSYMVHDPHSGDHKGQAEMRKGDEVKGEYWLMEPTGNKRTVKYFADHTGFHADVHNSHPHIHEIPKEEQKHEKEKHEEEKREEEKHEEEKREPEIQEPEIKEEEPIHHHPVYKTIVHQEIHHPYHYKHEEHHKHEEETHRPVKILEEIIHHKVHHKGEEHQPEVHHMKPIIIKPIHVPREPLVHYEPRPIYHEHPKVETHENELPLLSIYKPQYDHHRDHDHHHERHEHEDYGWIRGPHARHHRDAKKQRKFKIEDLNA